MGSRLWPPPNSHELAAIAAATNELEEPQSTECEDCGCTQEYCICEERDVCEICGGDDDGDCTCPSVYVHYATHVVVEVDYEGDITGVTVCGDLPDDPYDVQFEDGSRVPDGLLRRRALESCANREWPSWDIQ